MSIDSTWFRCPNCLRPISLVDPRVLGCDEGHRYDLSKHGTVTLLPPRAPHTMGDNREMLEARRDLLDSGIFTPIADAVVAALREVAPRGDDATLRIADLGCGTGYYAGRLADASPTAEFLVADRSPVAVRMAARAVPRSTGVVLDLWRPLPLRDGTADLAINVFAPRNPSEFARLLRTGGTLIVVVPTSGHLGELRASGRLLEIPAGKDAHVTAQLAAAGFTPARPVRVEYGVDVDAVQRAELVGMGPSAHHTAVLDDAGSMRHEPKTTPPLERVSVSVDVLAFRNAGA